MPEKHDRIGRHSRGKGTKASGANLAFAMAAFAADIMAVRLQKQ